MAGSLDAEAVVKVPSSGAAVVQWSSGRFGSLGISECMGSNPGHNLRGDWASTRGNSSEMGELSGRRSPLGGLL